MKRIAAAFLVVLAVLTVAGTALAENGPSLPWDGGTRVMGGGRVSR